LGMEIISPLFYWCWLLIFLQTIVNEAMARDLLQETHASTMHHWFFNSLVCKWYYHNHAWKYPTTCFLEGSFAKIWAGLWYESKLWQIKTLFQLIYMRIRWHFSLLLLIVNKGVCHLPIWVYLSVKESLERHFSCHWPWVLIEDCHLDPCISSMGIRWDYSTLSCHLCQHFTYVLSKCTNGC
jgi:hypothetical protein